MALSPNPTTEMISADYRFLDHQERSWELFDATGKQIFNFVTNDKQGFLSISLSTVSDGLYFLIIRENGMIIETEKIIKQ